MAVAEAWCVSSDEAKMAIAVPTLPQPEGVLAFNAHRIYGTLNYPYLVIFLMFYSSTEEADNYRV